MYSFDSQTLNIKTRSAFTILHILMRETSKASTRQFQFLSEIDRQMMAHQSLRISYSNSNIIFIVFIILMRVTSMVSHRIEKAWNLFFSTIVSLTIVTYRIMMTVPNRIHRTNQHPTYAQSKLPTSSRVSIVIILVANIPSNDIRHHNIIILEAFPTVELSRSDGECWWFRDCSNGLSIARCAP